VRWPSSRRRYARRSRAGWPVITRLAPVSGSSTPRRMFLNLMQGSSHAADSSHAFGHLYRAQRCSRRSLARPSSNTVCNDTIRRGDRQPRRPRGQSHLIRPDAHLPVLSAALPRSRPPHLPETGMRTMTSNTLPQRHHSCPSSMRQSCRGSPYFRSPVLALLPRNIQRKPRITSPHRCDKDHPSAKAIHSRRKSERRKSRPQLKIP
jgi:hypothetical protein